MLLRRWIRRENCWGYVVTADRADRGAADIAHGYSGLAIQMWHGGRRMSGLAKSMVNLMATNRSLTELFSIKLALERNIVASEDILLTLLFAEKVREAALRVIHGLRRASQVLIWRTVALVSYLVEGRDGSALVKGLHHNCR